MFGMNESLLNSTYTRMRVLSRGSSVRSPLTTRCRLICGLQQSMVALSCGLVYHDFWPSALDLEHILPNCDFPKRCSTLRSILILGLRSMGVAVEVETSVQLRPSMYEYSSRFKAIRCQSRKRYKSFNMKRFRRYLRPLGKSTTDIQICKCRSARLLSWHALWPLGGLMAQPLAYCSQSVSRTKNSASRMLLRRRCDSVIGNT